MKKAVAIIITLFTWISSAAIAQNYPFSEFVHNAGLHKGYARACGFGPNDVANYEGAVTRYAASHWPNEFRHKFKEIYEKAVIKAESDRKRKLDEDFCRGIRVTLDYGTDYPDSPYTHEFLAKHDQATAWRVEMERKMNAAAVKQKQAQAAEAQKVKKGVSAVGARVCREIGGTTRNVVGTSFGQPLYGRTTGTTFHITGFTEAFSDDRIKVLISAIREESTGQYIDALPPDYTKGVHTWENFTSWRPC